MSEIEIARMQADLETVRIAELYAGHPLLKNFSAPRLRLPHVSLEIPVAIEDTGESVTNAQLVESLWPSTRHNVDAIVAQEAVFRNVRLAPSALADLKTSLDTLFHELRNRQSLILENVVQAADQAERIVESSFAKGPFEQRVPPAPGSSGRTVPLLHRLQLEFGKLVPPLPRVTILATAAQLKEAGPLQNFSKLKLSISEEGVSWSQPDPDNSASAILVPE